MITNHASEDSSRLLLMATIEHEPEYEEPPLSWLLKPQALDIPPNLRERLALEFASGAPVYV